MTKQRALRRRSKTNPNNNLSTRLSDSRASLLQYNHLLKVNKIAVQSWLGHVKYIGCHAKFSDDYQHIMLSRTWGKLFQITVGSAFTLILLFAFFFYLSESVHNPKFSFFMSWNLSAQTFLTIGYGNLCPNTFFGNIAVYFEVFLSMAFGALLTGIVFLKFSKAKSPVIFSENMCVSNDANGRPVLRARICLARNNALLLLPRYEMSLVILEESFEGSHMIRLRNLSLQNSSILFNANMNLTHVLDENSPLYKHWKHLYTVMKSGFDFPKSRWNLAILVTCVGVEEAFQTEVRSEAVYYTSNLKFDYDFGDMFDAEGAFQRPEGYLASMHILKLSNVAPSKYRLTLDMLIEIKNALKETGVAEPVRDAGTGVHDIEMAERHADDLGHEFGRDMRDLEEEKSEPEESDEDITAAADSLVAKESGFCHKYFHWNKHDNFDPENEKGAQRRDHETRVFLRSLDSSSIFLWVSQILFHGSTWYWYTLKSSVVGVSAFIFSVYTLMTMAFATFILFDPIAFTDGEKNIANGNNSSVQTKSTTFTDAFDFATQTLSSVGYGILSPKTTYAHIVVSVLGFLGWVCISTMSGIVWSRFAKPKVRILFAKNVVVTMWNGERVLMIRLAGLFRSKPITECTIDGSALLNVTGGNCRKNNILKFVRKTNPIFNLPGTFMHVIDETSSLYNIRTESQALDAGLLLSFTATGFDSCFQDTVYTKATYSMKRKQILFDQHYRDILGFHEDYVVVDMHFFHETRKDPPSFLTYCFVRRFFRVLRSMIENRAKERQNLIADD